MSAGRQRSGRRAPWTVPALQGRPGGLLDRLAGRAGARPPVVVFLVALIGAFAVLVGVSLLLGLFVTDVLLQVGGVDRVDEDVVEAVVSGRTPLLTRASEVGSAVGGGTVLPAVAGTVALVCAALRMWSSAAFAAFVLPVESATYRVTSVLLPRDRPAVARLDHYLAKASYPSGHTAASTAVYLGLALLLTSALRRRGPRAAIWTVAAVIVAFVAAARVYRGMHHPLDVAGGGLVGAGSVVVVVAACRVAHRVRCLSGDGSSSHSARSPSVARRVGS